MCVRVARAETARPRPHVAVPAGLRNEIRFGHFFEGKKVTKDVCNVAKLATLCISICPTTGWATGQTENTRIKKNSAIKMNLR